MISTKEMDPIEAARRGHHGAVERLIELVWSDAFRIALSVVRDRTFAEDAAQEACAILFRSIRSLRSADAFKVWFFRIVMREAIKLERRALREQAPDQHPASDLGATDQRVDVRSALFKLPPRQRAAVVLHYYADLNSVEIAEILGIPDSSVRFHIMRAKRSLQHLLAREFENVM